MRIERTAKTVIAGLMSVACLASVAACGPGSSSNKANTETEAVSTDLGDTKYELKLWDGAGLKTFDDQLIEAFQKKYPNITIKATYDPDNTSQQNGPRIISAADTPDIARITDINSAVRGNHVVNLDAYADAYGWKLPDSQTQVYRVGSDGKIGSGSRSAGRCLDDRPVLEQESRQGTRHHRGSGHCRRARGRYEEGLRRWQARHDDAGQGRRHFLHLPGIAHQL